MVQLFSIFCLVLAISDILFIFIFLIVPALTSYRVGLELILPDMT
jgi:hypothetical protein